jgi:tripartite-type tricarboxylate transporter receptor subunit TctC
MVGMEVAAKSPPDGYTILIMSDSFPVIAATHKPAWDPVNSLVAVAQISGAPFGLIVHPSVPANSVAEFIALAKTKPNAYSYGSSGNGGLTHLISEMFCQMADIKMVHVPYKSTGCGDAGLPLRHDPGVRRQRLAAAAAHPAGEAEAARGHQRAALAASPDTPTIGETVKGFGADPWFGLFVPRGRRSRSSSASTRR